MVERKTTIEGSEPPLTDEERRALRDLIVRDARAKWLMSTLRVWATWIAAVFLAISVGWDSIKRVVKAAVGP